MIRIDEQPIAVVEAELRNSDALNVRRLRCRPDGSGLIVFELQAS